MDLFKKYPFLDELVDLTKPEYVYKIVEVTANGKVYAYCGL